MPYAWRSIIHVVNLAKEGYIWRIGNGEAMKIWGDPWIHVIWSRIISSQSNGNLLERVVELIRPVTRTWVEQLVVDIP
jgi:hypothetical protein